MVDYHDPRAATRIEHTPYSLGVTMHTGATIGLLANGFPDSQNFLDAVGRALEEQLPGITLKSWNKGDASVPASGDTLSEITSTCDGAIAAYGH